MTELRPLTQGRERAFEPSPADPTVETSRATTDSRRSFHSPLDLVGDREVNA